MGAGGSLLGSSLGGSLLGTAVHKFDTGLFAAQRTVVRLGVAEMLRPLLLPQLGGSANGYIRSIRGLPRPLRAHSEEELGWIGNAVQGQAPCVLIALGSKGYGPHGMDGPSVHYAGELEIVIYAVSLNSRAFIEGRLAADVVGTANVSNDPGIETLLEHIEELLIGQDPNVEGIHELRPQSEDEVFTGGETVWEQRYTCKVEREINPARLVTGIVTTIETKNNLDGANAANPVVDTITTVEVP